MREECDSQCIHFLPPQRIMESWEGTIKLAFCNAMTHLFFFKNYKSVLNDVQGVWHSQAQHPL